MRNKLLLACLIIMVSGAVLNLRLGYSLERLLPVFAAVLAGMFFVDLDVPLYFLRQKLVVAVITLMMVGFAALFYFYGGQIMKFCPLSGGLMCDGAYFFIALAISALVAHFFDVITPFKEGPLHGVLPSLGFGVLVLGACTYYFGTDIGMLSGFLAFFAAIVHLFLDAGQNN